MDHEARRGGLGELVDDLQREQPSTPEELAAARRAFMGHPLDEVLDISRGASAIDVAQLPADLDAVADPDPTPRPMLDLGLELDRRAQELARLRELVERFPDPSRFDALFAEAVEAIGDRERAASWMLSSIRALGGQTPIDVLGAGGDEELRRVLSVIAFGGVA